MRLIVSTKKPISVKTNYYCFIKKVSSVHLEAEKMILLSLSCLNHCHCFTVCNVDLIHKSHNAPLPYPTMHYFITEMCTCVHILLQNCELWDMGEVHCGICEMGILCYNWLLQQDMALLSLQYHCCLDTSSENVCSIFLVCAIFCSHSYGDLHLWLVDSPHKGPVVQKGLPSHEIIMSFVWVYLQAACFWDTPSASLDLLLYSLSLENKHHFRTSWGANMVWYVDRVVEETPYDWYNHIPFKALKWLNLVFTVPAEFLVPNSARPSAVTQMIAKSLSCFMSGIFHFTWGLWWHKWVYGACISNYFMSNIICCDYLSMPCVHVFDTKVLLLMG